MKKWSNYPRWGGQWACARWFEMVCGALVVVLLFRTDVDFITSPHTDAVALPTAVVQPTGNALADLLPDLNFRPGIQLELRDARPLKFNVAPEPAAKPPVEPTAPVVASKPEPEPKRVSAPARAPLPVVELPERLYPRTLFLRHPEYARKLDVPSDTLAQNLAECQAFVETHARTCYPRRTETGIPVSIQLGVALFLGEAGTDAPNFRAVPAWVAQQLKQTPKYDYRTWAAAATEHIDGLSAPELVRIIEALDLFLFDSMA